MKHDCLAITDARLLTMAGRRPRRGMGMGDLGIIPRGGVLIRDGRVEKVWRAEEEGPDLEGVYTVDARGAVVMPAFVDCHTHACWCGDRLDEWCRRIAGEPYLEILASGGGIMSTVRSVREEKERTLAEIVAEHAGVARSHGTCLMEVKSGYGLTKEHELKMLRAIVASQGMSPIGIVPTALLGHAIDNSVPGFVERTIEETLPAVHALLPGAAVDAFCEQGAWSVEQTLKLLRAAQHLGHPVRVHADQFNSLGMLREAVKLGARSVDHLEASTPEDLEYLAQSDTFAVGLPYCGLHMADGRYADLRRVADAGGAVCIASNFNPGSAPSLSMPLAIALAVRFCGLTPREAIVAATINPACLLGDDSRGAIVPGARGDLLMLRSTDERDLAHAIGDDPIRMVVAGGRMMSRRA